MNYLVVFLEKRYQTYIVVGKLKFRKQIPRTIQFRGGSFIPNLECPTHLDDRLSVYVLDVLDGATLTYNADSVPITPNDLDVIVGNHILRDIAAGVMSKKETIYAAIMGAIMGGLCAAMIAILYYTEKIQQLLQSTGSLPFPIG